MRIRLTAKITVLIILVLIIGFGVATLLTIKRESELLVEQNKMAARQLIGTLVSSIETAMLSERPDITRGLIDDLRSSKLVQGLVVYRRNGVEAFTDLATLREVSKEAELPKDVMASIEKMRREPGRTMAGPLFTRALETMQMQEALESRDGATMFTVYQPIPNQERCQGCHGSDHKVRAVIQAATSMEPVMAEVRMQRNRQIMIGLLTILAAAAVLAVAMRHVVVRPIHELAAVARRIGEGDFAVRARAGSGDEVAELGGALNDMTGHLERAQQNLAARNTELATALENLQASRQRLEVLEQLKGELSKFVPDAVKELLERDPSATSLEKRNEEVSVLFLDIAGYTRLSEQLEAKRLNQLVQTYFSSFLEIIRRAPRRRERDRGRRAHGDLPEAAARARRGRRGPRAERDPGRLRDPPADDRAERGVRGRVPGHRAPHGDQHRPGAGGRHQAERGRVGALDVHRDRAHHQHRGAVRGRRGGRGHRGGPGDRRSHRRALRAGIARRAQLQERLAAPPDLPGDPARRVQQGHVSGAHVIRPGAAASLSYIAPPPPFQSNEVTVTR